MEFINATRMQTGYTMAIEPTGGELLVVVVKGTFVMPRSGEEVRLHEAQAPLVLADTFTGEPGISAPEHEMDFAPRKPLCDVLLLGHARSPGGRPVTRMHVSVRVGEVVKEFSVVGDRMWQSGATGIRISSPQPFVEKLISYDTAFGGVDRFSEDGSEHDAFLPNPVGRGWHKHLRNSWVDGTLLPNTEEIGRGVSFPDDRLRPMALGPVGRGWSGRACYAGTYDQQWLDEVFPFLPKDFDERYHQAAAVDQQIPAPKQPVQVVLSGFTADGPRQFVLPHFEAPVKVFPKRGRPEDYLARLDTIAFEPDDERFTMTWRMARPLKQSIHEVAQVLVGRKGKAWWQQREQAFPIPVVMLPTGEGGATHAP